MTGRIRRRYGWKGQVSPNTTSLDEFQYSNHFHVRAHKMPRSLLQGKHTQSNVFCETSPFFLLGVLIIELYIRIILMYLLALNTLERFFISGKFYSNIQHILISLQPFISPLYTDLQQLWPCKTWFFQRR